MRLRRFEIVLISVTLAFGCFIGGYFAGRSTGAISISPMVQLQNGSSNTVHAFLPEASGGSVQERSAALIPVPAETLPPQDAAADTQRGAAETYMPPTEQPPPQSGAVVSGRDSEGRININTASRSELTDLPGIGSSLSERIVDYRNLNGPFRTVEELRNVSGIGEKRFEAIRNKITV